MSHNGRHARLRLGKSKFPVPVLYRLLTYLRPYRARLFLGFAILVLDVVFELAPAFVWLYIVDHVVMTRNVNGLIPAVAALIGIAGTEALLSGLRRRLLESIGQAFVFDLRNAVVAKLTALPLGFFNERQTGDLLSRATSDIESLQEAVINGTDSLLANALRILGVCSVFLWLNPLLGSATILPMVGVGLLLAKFSSQVRGAYKTSREQLGKMTARLQDTLGGIRVVKGFAREAVERSALAQTAQRYREANLQAVETRTRYFPWITFVSSFGNTIMIGFGAYLIIQGRFTLGGLVAFRSYGRYFFGPIDNLTQINDLLQRAIAAGNRIFEVIDAEETVRDAPEAKPLVVSHGELAFEDVSFSYAGDATEDLPSTLTDVSFVVRPGQRVALIGESGAGKSTVFALAQRFWDPSSGRVTIDGQDLREVTQESLRRQVVSVQQETFLFTATVMENLRYGNPEASDEEVEAATRAANAHGFISRLPQGYDTVVGERGVKLSGGQRQRISVARAFLAGGRILLLDEATSAVEPESERVIYEGLQRLMEGRTTLIATHRLSTVKNADLIVVLEGGRIVETGTHDESTLR